MRNQYNDQNKGGDLLVNALKGAVAGAVGVWVMDRLDWLIFKNEDPAARHQTESVRPGGLDPAHVAVSKAADAVGGDLSPAQPNRAGIGLHYALGIGPAALYGAFRDRLPVRADGQDHLYGAALGLGLFAIQDEGLNSVMGLSASPKDYPKQAHARGFVAHLVLGVVTNTMLNLLKAPRPSPQPMRGVADSHRGVQEEKSFASNLPLPVREEEARGEVH